MKNQPNKKKQKKKKSNNSIYYYSQIGIRMVLFLIAGVFLGQFLDNRFDSRPWLLLIFSLLGVVLAFKVLFELGNKK